MPAHTLEILNIYHIAQKKREDCGTLSVHACVLCNVHISWKCCCCFFKLTLKRKVCTFFREKKDRLNRQCQWPIQQVSNVLAIGVSVIVGNREDYKKNPNHNHITINSNINISHSAHMHCVCVRLQLPQISMCNFIVHRFGLQFSSPMSNAIEQQQQRNRNRETIAATRVTDKKTASKTVEKAINGCRHTQRKKKHDNAMLKKYTHIHILGIRRKRKNIHTQTI